MFSIKLVAVAFLASSLIAGATSSSCRWTHGNSPVNKSMSSSNENMPADEIKVLAEGFYSPIETSFVAVVRDAETYGALRKMAGNLPGIAADSFKSSIVIAAFLGTRNTAGYSVEITRTADWQIRIAEKAPPKDAMLAQVITSPFKVVSLPIAGSPPVPLSFGETFQQGVQLYRISNGTFSVSGGIAGRTQTFQLDGKLQVTRLGDLITVGFAVVGSGAPRERILSDSATGLIKNNEIAISKLSRGSLLDSPSGELRASGRFAEKNRLMVELDSGPVTVPDGFSGKGTIEAEMVAASAN